MACARKKMYDICIGKIRKKVLVAEYMMEICPTNGEISKRRVRGVA